MTDKKNKKRSKNTLKQNLFLQGWQDGTFGRGIACTLAPSKTYMKGYRKGVKALVKIRNLVHEKYPTAKVVSSPIIPLEPLENKDLK